MRRISTISFLASFLFFSPPVFVLETDAADPDKESEPIPLPGVTVKDTRPRSLTTPTLEISRERLDEVPGATTVIDNEEINSRVHRSLEDVLVFSPGVYAESFAAGPEMVISIRGSGILQAGALVLQQWSSILSPMLAIRSVSASMAATDLAHWRDFADAAERYRRTFETLVNTDNAKNGGDLGYNYRADPALWSQVEPFRYDLPSFPWALKNAVPSIIRQSFLGRGRAGRAPCGDADGAARSVDARAV